MRFWLTLTSLTFLLAPHTGAFANQATTLPPTTETPAVEAPTCLEPDVVMGDVLTGVPDASIKEISKGPPYSITFTSPSMPTDYVVEFDENNCAVRGYTISEIVS